MDREDELYEDCYAEEYMEGYLNGYDRGYDAGFSDDFDDDLDDEFDEATHRESAYDFSDFDDLVKLLEDLPENDSTLYYND